jgi:hypothetical protein
LADRYVFNQSLGALETRVTAWFDPAIRGEVPRIFQRWRVSLTAVIFYQYCGQRFCAKSREQAQN